MTVQKPEDYETGLEDFDSSDAVVPRLSIAHRDGEFEDSLSKERFSSVKVIILGLVKQRSLWHPDLDEDNAGPMCKSNDHDTGYPNYSEDQPKKKRFPYSLTPFEKPDDTDEIQVLQCGECPLKEWETHPDGKKPYCTEQFTLPILYDPQENGSWVPAIITFQKTSLKPLKTYLTSFARSRNAAFMALTEISLEVLKRGSTEYSVPSFRRIGSTDDDEWRNYSKQYREMKDFLEEPPTRREGNNSDKAAPGENNWPGTSEKSEAKSSDAIDVEEEPSSAPAQEKVKSPVKEEKQESEPPAAADDSDDLPF